MNALLRDISEDDFIWRAISERIVGQASRARTNFVNIKCPMCRDYKRRCGIKVDSRLVIKCYNCQFTTGWSLGSPIGSKLREFLSAIGCSDTEISRLIYKAFTYRHLIQSNPDVAIQVMGFAAPSFDAIPLPPGSRSFSEWVEEGCRDQNFLDAQAYIRSRGDEIAEGYDYFWTPTQIKESGMNRRVIIPLKHDGLIYGYSARAIDRDNKQRYHMRAPENFLFNSAAMSDPERHFIIIAEGILDAVGLDCVSTLGSHLNDEQIRWIKSYGKEVIMLVDRDGNGVKMIEPALENGWKVSFPAGGSTGWWEPDVKDAAEAVKRYGSLWTLTSVIEEATDNAMKINFHKKKILSQHERRK